MPQARDKLEVQGEKILVFDLETTASVGEFFGKKYETNIVRILEDSRIISFSAKWVGEKEFITKSWIDYKGRNIEEREKKLVKELYLLMKDATHILGQNSDNFDLKLANSRFLHFGFDPLPPIKQMDTKKMVKKSFLLPSYSLDDMCRYFNLPQKVKHDGYDMWVRCLALEKKAHKEMKEYNQHDTYITEQLYLKVRPWVKNHPNLGLYYGKIVCPKCGQAKLTRAGKHYTLTKEYMRFRCNGCHGWSQFPTAEVQDIKPLKPL